jgi:outer membrane protein OmpA-like peptidoglycan-associated protein
MQKKFFLRKPLTLIISIAIASVSIVTSQSFANAAPPRTYLCTSGNYVLLADIITNAAGTTITSSVPSLVGASSAAALAGLSGSEVGSVTNETSTAQHLEAISNLRVAMEAATSLATSGAELISGELSTDHSVGSAPGTFTPGIYKTAAGLNIAAGSIITLSGPGYFYFSSGAALTMGAGVTFKFTNGADPHNLYWVAGTIAGDMSLGANSSISGNFMARGTATFGAGAHLYGRLLVLNTITLAANVTISSDYSDLACAPRMASVPEITTKLKAAAEGLIVVDFKVGQVTYTSVGANVNNNGTVASYTPTGTVAAGTPIDYVLYQYTPPALPILTINFTDTTLIDAKVGVSYSDKVLAVTKSDGILSNVSVTYALTGFLPTGLAFDTTTGTISGKVMSETEVGTYNYVVVASAAGGYTSQTFSLKLNVLTATTSSNSNIPVLSIGFTDVTLVDGRAGGPYSDYVEARTLSGATYSNLGVSYALTGTLPTGLVFNQVNGFITGIISKDAVIGIYPLIFTASSSMHTSASSVISLRVLTATPVIPPILSIGFTDFTLIDGRAGDPYSDYVQAKTYGDGTLNGGTVTYVLTGTLPLGLIFNSSNGYLTGTVSKDAFVGTYNVTVAALSSGYTTQTLGFSFKVAAAPIIPVVPAVSPVGSPLIVFTDTTLVDAYLGRSYADYVKAKAFNGSVSNSTKISYSLTGILPTGLSFSGSTGYVMGSVAKNATVGIYKVTVSAFASGYTTQQLIYELTVRATAVPTPSKTATPDPTPTSVVATKMILMDTIWFDSGKSLLTSSSKVALNTMIKTLVASPFKTVAINGFTDAVKGQPHTALSLARAKAVHSYILARTVGMKISSKGLGLAPSSANSSKSLQQSRKAEIWVG